MGTFLNHNTEAHIFDNYRKHAHRKMVKMYNNILNGILRGLLEAGTGQVDDDGVISVEARNGVVTENDMYEIIKLTTPKLFLQQGIKVLDGNKTCVPLAITMSLQLCLHLL